MMGVRLQLFRMHIRQIYFIVLLSSPWFVCSWSLGVSSALNPTFWHAQRMGRYRSARSSAPLAQIVDAEFERVHDQTIENTDFEGFLSDSSKSLLDLAYEADPDFNTTRIPFIWGENYIDTKLAFMAELDGVQYGIGIPFDHVAAVAIEEQDGSVSYLSPDKQGDDDELFEIMAVQLQEHVGSDLSLKRTPRVLTIVGPLEKYTTNWKSELIPKPVEKEELLDESDEDLDYFYKFMRQELGDEEFEKTMKETPENIDPSLLKLFDIPGLGDQEDDEEGIKEILESLLEHPANEVAELRKLRKDLEHDGVALKLISYVLPDGKSYSLVYRLKPNVLVAKCLDQGKDLSFELLSTEEERLVVPRLEAICRDDLVKAGMQL